MSDGISPGVWGMDPLVSWAPLLLLKKQFWQLEYCVELNMTFIMNRKYLKKYLKIFKILKYVKITIKNYEL
jgi:hypothetical protein